MEQISKPVSLSNSSSNEIASCARKYQIRKRFQHSVSIYDKSLPAQSGTAVHTYLQSRMAGKSDQDAMLDLFWEWDFNVEANDSPKNKRERNLEAVIHTSHQAWKKIQFEPDHLAQIESATGIQKPATEVGFEITLSSKLYDEPYIYVGYIDFITYLRETSMFNVWDIKTNRDLSTAPKDYKYKYDTQTIPYGLVISAITGESVDNFNANYLDIMIDPLEPRVQVVPFNRTHKDIDHWLRSLDRQIRMINEYKNDPVWPRTTTGCVSWGKPCRYFKYCDINEPYNLQLALLSFGPPKPEFKKDIDVKVELDVDKWLGR